MPELPEVETVKNTLKKVLLNKRIENVRINYDNIIEYPSSKEFIEKIKGQYINDIHRRGKWLMFELTDYYLLSHLRMEGKYFLKHIQDEIEKHEHVLFELDSGEELRYRDTRKFGKMLLIPKDEILECKQIKELGLEPWDNKLTSFYLMDKYKNKKLPIKSVLLEQSIITGIGNIYADEILFLSKINPCQVASSLTNENCEEIIKHTREVLERAIELGGTTIRSYESSEGVHGRFQINLLVHNRKDENCPNCGTPITKIVVGGRGTYYCKVCQK